MVTLSSENISLTLIPELGGVISSIKFLPNGTEMLARIRDERSPEISRLGRTADNLLDLLFIGGYYEILPNAGYITEYNGIEFGLHDETPYIPWKLEYDEERDPNSILLIVSLIKYPLKLFRRITLRDNTIVFDERLVNLSPTSTLPFSWLHHPTFGEEFIGEDSILELPENTQLEVDSFLESDSTCLRAGYKGNWPSAMQKNGKLEDLSRFPSRGSRNCDDLVYVPVVREGTFTIRNNKKRIALRATWDKEIFGAIWLWRPFGGGNGYPWFGRVYCAAVEIATSTPVSGLGDQVKLGTAKWIHPNEEIKTTLKYEIIQEE
ncbi:MAG: aldose 1-epimerase [Candidatus Thermoplasmatota archaeon]|nr:aldose 1-epimerase [Candidatus Thermoplasmatota archaeon]